MLVAVDDDARSSRTDAEGNAVVRAAQREVRRDLVALGDQVLQRSLDVRARPRIIRTI
ncbi:hypothetical protein [Anaeromyxobacter oryzisoli]|uniref:hypothetical protein n=1 Tax=Anaeromyxobacter oryzisoli TaxID=2925408 RepID=UPI001F56D129|nr:hypothetical protein [Anaeromyxobacter sp. SG63]